MNGIIRKNPRMTPYLVQISAALETTPAYLTGATDEPDVGAPLPQPRPDAQLVTMQVALPGEDALTRMFLGVLEASPGMALDALARELARSLPSGLRLLRGPLTFGDQGRDDDPRAAVEALPSADRGRQRASRT
ncbi:hypothetical protein [uncultured Sphingomonas sp.]|uniref:hypothetical protein n=1 Tax=uncultured Sphingomonas sp. TaxID=158754 RepID=UPI0025F86DDC|nr:hypothetical protein [uncultured Sphingomonas sp.]